MSIVDRKHPIIARRERKLRLNRLAYIGGEDYVHERLWRAPNESLLSWEGKSFVQDYGAWETGRRDRAVCHREGGRIADKINQYLFAKPVKRQGVNAEFDASAGVMGESLAEVWQQISLAVTLCGWCWIGVVQPEIPKGASVADVQRSGLRTKLAMLWPWEVPDWSFDGSGGLRWAITEAEVRDDSDPSVESKPVKVRTLWRRGTDGTIAFDLYRDGRLDRSGKLGPGKPIPLLLVGRPTYEPWWFDEVESEQALLMNLASLHAENLTRTVYPQLIISAGTFDNLESRLVERQGTEGGRAVIAIVKEITRSADVPIVEGAEEKGITRYIQPSASDLKAIPDSIRESRAALFDRVGLSLFNREQRQIQTAESKAFDHLDTSATLRQRADLLERAERASVSLLRQLDPSFQAYEPVWNRDFDVTDVTGDAHALLQVGNLPGLTLTQRKAILRAATTVLEGIAPLSEEDRTTIDSEIDSLTDDTGLPTI